MRLGLSTGSLAPEVELAAGGKVRAGVPPLGQASAEAGLRAAHIDPARRERSMTDLLDRVVNGLGGGRLPSLEASEHMREGEWFRFHRDLQFGNASNDQDPDQRAFVAIDREPMRHGSPIPGLMMNGSLAHVLPPYATEGLRECEGSRSGSGTGVLFRMLHEIDRRWEDDPGLDMRALETAGVRQVGARGPSAAFDMYGLLTGSDWLARPKLPRLLDGAPCEGVAQASYVAVEEQRVLVMASPLHIQVRPLEARGR